MENILLLGHGCEEETPSSVRVARTNFLVEMLVEMGFTQEVEVLHMGRDHWGWSLDTKAMRFTPVGKGSMEMMVSEGAPIVRELEELERVAESRKHVSASRRLGLLD